MLANRKKEQEGASPSPTTYYNNRRLSDEKLRKQISQLFVQLGIASGLYSQPGRKTKLRTVQWAQRAVARKEKRLRDALEEKGIDWDWKADFGLALQRDRILRKYYGKLTEFNLDPNHILPDGDIDVPVLEDFRKSGSTEPLQVVNKSKPLEDVHGVREIEVLITMEDTQENAELIKKIQKDQGQKTSKTEKPKYKCKRGYKSKRTTSDAIKLPHESNTQKKNRAKDVFAPEITPTSRSRKTKNCRFCCHSNDQENLDQKSIEEKACRLSSICETPKRVPLSSRDNFITPKSLQLGFHAAAVPLLKETEKLERGIQKSKRRWPKIRRNLQFDDSAAIPNVSESVRNSFLVPTEKECQLRDEFISSNKENIMPRAECSAQSTSQSKDRGNIDFVTSEPHQMEYPEIDLSPSLYDFPCQDVDVYIDTLLPSLSSIDTSPFFGDIEFPALPNFNVKKEEGAGTADSSYVVPQQNLLNLPLSLSRNANVVFNHDNNLQNELLNTPKSQHKQGELFNIGERLKKKQKKKVKPQKKKKSCSRKLSYMGMEADEDVVMNNSSIFGNLGSLSLCQFNREKETGFDTENYSRQVAKPSSINCPLSSSTKSNGVLKPDDNLQNELLNTPKSHRRLQEASNIETRLQKVMKKVVKPQRKKKLTCSRKLSYKDLEADGDNDISKSFMFGNSMSSAIPQMTSSCMMAQQESVNFQVYPSRSENRALKPNDNLQNEFLNTPKFHPELGEASNVQARFRKKRKNAVKPQEKNKETRSRKQSNKGMEADKENYEPQDNVESPTLEKVIKQEPKSFYDVLGANENFRSAAAVNPVSDDSPEAFNFNTTWENYLSPLISSFAGNSLEDDVVVKSEAPPPSCMFQDPQSANQMPDLNLFSWEEEEYKFTVPTINDFADAANNTDNPQLFSFSPTSTVPAGYFTDEEMSLFNDFISSFDETPAGIPSDEVSTVPTDF